MLKVQLPLEPNRADCSAGSVNSVSSPRHEERYFTGKNTAIQLT